MEQAANSHSPLLGEAVTREPPGTPMQVLQGALSSTFPSSLCVCEHCTLGSTLVRSADSEAHTSAS